MENILNLYGTPYDPEQPLICFYEKPYQLTDHVTRPLPSEPGITGRIDYNYKREDVCNILCAPEPATGQGFVRITEYRTRQDYARLMKELREICPLDRKIRLVQDKLNTRSGGSFYETFDAQTADRLNMVEIELSALSKNCPDQRIPSPEKLHRIMAIRVQQRNDACAKINWQFSTDDARIRFKHFYKI